MNLHDLWVRLFSQKIRTAPSILTATATPAVAKAPIFSFIVSARPGSHNKTASRSPTKAAYIAAVDAAFKSRYAASAPLTHSLYCRVYYFYRKEERRDPDNLSKPTLDSLRTLAFTDDFLVKLRTAGSQNIGSAPLHMIDTTKMDSDVLVDFYNSIGTNDHTIYVEIGNLVDVGYPVGC